MSLRNLHSAIQKPARYAEGGTSSSRQILDYLLGKTVSSRAPQTVTQMPTVGLPKGSTGLGSTTPGHYTYDPATQTFNWVGDAAPAATTDTAAYRPSGSGASWENADSGGSGSWSSLSNADKAKWYADHPGWASVTQGLQSLFGATGLGLLQRKMDPEGVYTQQAVARGYDPAQGMQQEAQYSQGLADLAAQGRAEQQAQQAAQQAADDAAFEQAWNAAQNEYRGSSATSYGSDSGGYSGGSDSNSNSDTSSSSGPLSSWGGSSGDARGGYLRGGQFDQRMAHGGIATLAGGGMYNLGSYSDGGRLLKGPGDGVSDSIPATIGQGRPARLADGEFVVPARIVSELGNGSTDAGARKLYAMMDRIQKARGKTTGKKQVAVNSRADKHLPA